MTNTIELPSYDQIQKALVTVATRMAEITEEIWAPTDLNQPITLTFAQDGFDGEEVDIASNCYAQLVVNLNMLEEWCLGWHEALFFITTGNNRIEQNTLTYTADIFAILEHNFGEMKPEFKTENATQTPLFEAVRSHLINAAQYEIPCRAEMIRDMGEDWAKSHDAMIDRLTLDLIHQLETGKNPLLSSQEQDNETVDREPMKIEFHAPTGKNQIIVSAIDSNNHTAASLTANLPVATQMGAMNNQDVRYALFWKLLHHLDSEVASDILDNTSLSFSYKTDALQTETDLSTEDLSTLILNVHRIEIDH